MVHAIRLPEPPESFCRVGHGLEDCRHTVVRPDMSSTWRKCRSMDGAVYCHGVGFRTAVKRLLSIEKIIFCGLK